MSCQPRSGIPAALLKRVIEGEYARRQAEGLYRPTLEELQRLTAAHGGATQARISSMRWHVEHTPGTPQLSRPPDRRRQELKGASENEASAEIARQARRRREEDRATSLPSPYAAADEYESRALALERHRRVVADHFERERRIRRRKGA